MPVKCSFCCKRYAPAGTYETHLQSEYSNLNIVLSYSHPLYGIHLRTSLLTGGLTYLTPTNPSNSPILTTNQVLPETQPCSEHDAPDDTLKWDPKTEVHEDNTYQVGDEQGDYPGAGKLLGRLKSTRKNAGVCARTHGLHLLVHKVLKVHLGSIRAKAQRCGLTITFRIVSETRHPSAIALCILWRIFSNPWIRIARICNG